MMALFGIVYEKDEIEADMLRRQPRLIVVRQIDNSKPLVGIEYYQTQWSEIGWISKEHFMRL
jgi:hypothetical protein